MTGKRMPRELYYTWDDLRALVETSDRGRIWEEIRGAPRRWRRALALALSVAKWAPERLRPGAGACGLCCYYSSSDRTGCKLCPLGRHWGHGCASDGSLWMKWRNNPWYDTRGGDAARRIYEDLCDLYAAELRRLGWL